MKYFDFQLLDNQGSPTGPVIEVGTIDGVILLCPAKIDVENARHICQLAINTPHYPHDLTIWQGADPNPYLSWSARIYYRSGDNVNDSGIRGIITDPAKA